MWATALLVLALAQSSPAAQDEASFIEQARQATARYQNQSAAILDGYRRIGRDFPAMGEHWIKTGLLFDGKFDPAHPEILAYANVSGKPRLLGVAYALPLLQGESAPDRPVGRNYWHDHFRTIDDETFLPQHHVTTGHEEHGPRLAMLHAWIWAANPEGPFAADNWNIPYLRLGISPPVDAPVAAARAVSLATGSTEYFLMAADAVAHLSSEERLAVEAAIARSRSIVENLLQDRDGTGLSAAPLKALSKVWEELWTAIDAAVRPETRERLQQLSVRHLN